MSEWENMYTYSDLSSLSGIFETSKNIAIFLIWFKSTGSNAGKKGLKHE